MPNRVDAPVQAVQAAELKPAVDRVFSRPERDQLLTRHYAVLTACQIRDSLVAAAPLPATRLP
jgi:hypothetical protein